MTTRTRCPLFTTVLIMPATSLRKDALVSVTHIGIMRAVNLARVDVSPVQYNPVTNTLRVYDELEFDIRYLNADVAGTIALKQSKASPYFNSTYSLIGNYQPLSPLLTN